MGFLLILPNIKKVNGLTKIVICFPSLQRKSDSVWLGSLREDKIQEADRTHAVVSAQILTSCYFISSQGSVIQTSLLPKVCLSSVLWFIIICYK